MAKIREDFEGAVHVNGLVLVAGDEIPEGARVGSHLTDEPEPAPVEAPADGDDFDPLAEEPEPVKPSARKRKAS